MYLINQLIKCHYSAAIDNQWNMNNSSERVALKTYVKTQIQYSTEDEMK